MQPAFDLESWRRRIPLLATTIPLNNCSQAPLLEPVRAAADAWLDGWNRNGMDWEGWIGEVEAARGAFARLIHASPDNVAVCGSVSDATNRLASALDWQGPRNRIVLSDAEFPSVAQVWHAQESRGAELVWIPLRNGRPHLEDWAAAIDERTLIVSACHGYFLNGHREDLTALSGIAGAAGALLSTDAYQTAGVSPIDVSTTPVDALAAGCLKYLLGTAGLAFLYVKPDVANTLHPTATGWFGRANPFAFDPRQLDWGPGARRFDGGTPPILNAAICRAGIEVILEVGVEAIHAWTSHLADRLLEQGRAHGLVPHLGTPGRERTPTTAFICPDAAQVEAAMRAEGVLVSARGPVLRFAPHFFIREDEIDRAVALAARFIPAESRA